jgi:hypothetical protein
MTTILNNDADCVYSFPNGVNVALRSRDNNLQYDDLLDLQDACNAAGVDYDTVRWCNSDNCACSSHPAWVIDTDSVDYQFSWTNVKRFNSLKRTHVKK